MYDEDDPAMIAAMQETAFLGSIENRSVGHRSGGRTAVAAPSVVVTAAVTQNWMNLKSGETNYLGMSFKLTPEELKSVKAMVRKAATAAMLREEEDEEVLDLQELDATTSLLPVSKEEMAEAAAVVAARKVSDVRPTATPKRTALRTVLSEEAGSELSALEPSPAFARAMAELGPESDDAMRRVWLQLVQAVQGGGNADGGPQEPSDGLHAGEHAVVSEELEHGEGRGERGA